MERSNGRSVRDEARNFQRSGEVYQMQSGFPRHFHAGAHDSRHVLTYHVIYQLSFEEQPEEHVSQRE
jgi:hypothetical protein